MDFSLVDTSYLSLLLVECVCYLLFQRFFSWSQPVSRWWFTISHWWLIIKIIWLQSTGSSSQLLNIKMVTKLMTNFVLVLLSKLCLSIDPPTISFSSVCAYMPWFCYHVLTVHTYTCSTEYCYTNGWSWFYCGNPRSLSWRSGTCSCSRCLCFLCIHVVMVIPCSSIWHLTRLD